MGVLPLEFKNDESFESLGIKGDEVFSIELTEIKPHQDVTLDIVKDGKKKQVKLKVRIDTPIEVEYYRHGGIMPYVLRQLLKA